MCSKIPVAAFGENIAIGKFYFNSLDPHTFTDMMSFIRFIFVIPGKLLLLKNDLIFGKARLPVQLILMKLNFEQTNA